MIVDENGAKLNAKNAKPCIGDLYIYSKDLSYLIIDIRHEQGKPHALRALCVDSLGYEYIFVWYDLFVKAAVSYTMFRL